MRARFPTGRKPHTTRYNYEDDSDLEEDDDDDIVDDEPASPPQVVTKKPRDSDSENNDSRSETERMSGGSFLFASELSRTMISESSDTKGGTETTSSAHIGKVAVIEDVAFVT